MSKSKIKTIKKENKLNQKKLFEAKADFDEMLQQIKPYIKRTSILLTSTDGKWFDTTNVTDKIICKDSIYN